jgi:phosphoglycerate kinase
MKDFLTLDNLDATGKRVLVRLDLNLPLQKGQVTDLTRLTRSLSTLKELTAVGAKVIVMSHLGRPQGYDPSLTMAPIAQALEQALAPTPVFFCEELDPAKIGEQINALPSGAVLLLENIRFWEGEEKNDSALAQQMAQWGDVYVNDAFSTAHRAHASTEAIAHLLPAYAGRLMEEELQALDKALTHPQRPLMAIVGGSKVSTKLPLLENLLKKVDVLVIGGAMANTFLKARGDDIGASLYEPDWVETAKELMNKEKEILLPFDVAVAKSLDDPDSIRTWLLQEIQEGEKIFDLGPLTCLRLLDKMATCHTLLWNGPVGVFEVPPFDKGTTILALGAGDLTQQGSLLSIAGGGDTVAALSHSGAMDKFTYVSTAGGAFLEWLEGKSLPGVEALKRGEFF